MKKLLLLTLLFGLPSPLFAYSDTDDYKQEKYCKNTKDDVQITLMKKENDNSKKWGVYACTGSSCSWADKAVSYDTAVDKYNEKSEKESCNVGTTYIIN